ncbi:MAG: 50S ribosomal protein L35 [Candidatus Marinimicrobia bacterium]|nr:50S ribosomal protein L35 [Candidatus Neomarinimicrobiota bacterium]
MPKVKTRKSAAKRFRKTGTGKLKHGHTGARHLLTRKSKDRKRRLRTGTLISKAMSKRTKVMIGS